MTLQSSGSLEIGLGKPLDWIIPR
ncbi:hypothetical protein LINPERHAP2_LOCUS11559 [Linum perenne]